MPCSFNLTQEQSFDNVLAQATAPQRTVNRNQVMHKQRVRLIIQSGETFLLFYLQSRCDRHACLSDLYVHHLHVQPPRCYSSIVGFDPSSSWTFLSATQRNASEPCRAAPRRAVSENARCSSTKAYVNIPDKYEEGQGMGNEWKEEISQSVQIK